MYDEILSSIIATLTPPSIETQQPSSSDVRPKTMPFDIERKVNFFLTFYKIYDRLYRFFLPNHIIYY